MNRKRIVLLADEASQQEVEAAGVIPKHRFRPFADLRDAANDGDGHLQVFLWPYSPALQVDEDPDDDRVLSRLLGMPADKSDEEAEEDVAALLDCLLVHLVFIGPPTADGKMAADTVASIAKVHDWYRRFHGEVKHRFQAKHAGKFTSVLVLVTTGDVHPTPEEVEGINMLAEPNGPLGDFVSTCYFVGYRLELGNQEVFHSPDVWPVLVGRLLLSFMLRDVGQLGRGVRIWRTFEFIPDFDAAAAEDLVRHRLAEAYNAAVENAGGFDDRSWRVVCLSPPETVRQAVDLKRPPEEPYAGSWDEFPARDRAAEVAGPKRWVDQLRETGENFMKGLRARLFGPNDVDPFDAQALFAKIHGKPSCVYESSRRLLLEQINESDLRGGQEGATRRWKALMDAESERLRRLEDLAECAGELDAARNHYLRMGYGFLVFLATALVCGVTFSRLLVSLGADFPTAAAVGGCGVFGALLAWLSVWWLQYLRGWRAVEQFQDLCEEADRAMVERDRLAREVLTDADAAWLALRRQAAVFRLRLLVDRAKAMLHTELQQHGALALTCDDSGNTSAFSLETYDQTSRRIANRLRFLERTAKRMPLDIRSDQFDCNTLERLLAQMFPTDADGAHPGSLLALWSRLCAEKDPYMAGNLPARAFVPALRAFVRRFASAMAAEIRRQVVSRDVNRRVLSDWVQTEVEGICDSDDYHYFSAIFRLVQTRKDRVDSLLFVRSDYLGHITSSDGSPTVVEDKAGALDSLPPVALLFEEAAVKLGINAENHLGLQEER